MSTNRSESTVKTDVPPAEQDHEPLSRTKLPWITPEMSETDLDATEATGAPGSNFDGLASYS